MKNRIKLEQLSVKHIDFVMGWINDPEVVKNFQNFGKRFTRKKELQFIKQLVKSKNDRVFSIFTTEGTYVGQCGINQISRQNKLARLSLFITKNQWNKGYAQEAISLLLHTAFIKLKLHKVWIMFYTTNKKALHLYKKAGFVKEGVLKDEYFWNGKYHDIVRMAIINKKINS